MKSIRFLSISVAALVLGLSAAHSQQIFGGKPQRDPFLKDRGAPATAPDTSDNLTALTVAFETYSLAQADVASLLTLAPDAATRYSRVKELVAAGRAKLTNVEASTAKSGKHTTVESIDVVQLAGQWYPAARRDDPVIGASISENHYGDRAEFEVILGADGRSCNLNFTVVTDRLNGFREYRTDADRAKEPLPISEKRQILTSIAMRTGEPVFLGTLNPAVGSTQQGADTAVVFGRVLVDKDRPESPAPALGAVGYAEQVLIFYSMDRAKARDILATHTKPGAAYGAVRGLADQQQARLEHVVSVPSQAGVLAKNDENIVTMQPGGSSPPVAFAELPQQPKGTGFAYMPSMSGKNLGLSVELNSVVGPPDALLKGLPLAADLDVNLWWRADAGMFKPAGIAPLYPETGVAESRHLANSLTCYVGVPTLLGTVNPPGDTGVNERKDSGRVWLAFIQVTPVKP